MLCFFFCFSGSRRKNTFQLCQLTNRGSDEVQMPFVTSQRADIKQLRALAPSEKVNERNLLPPDSNFCALFALADSPLLSVLSRDLPFDNRARRAGRAEEWRTDEDGAKRGGWREVTAAALSNCVDKKQASFISPSHSPLPLSPPVLHLCLSLSLHLPLPLPPSVSLRLSVTEAKNNEVTPLSRTVPYKKKNSPVVASQTAAPSPPAPRPPRDRPAPRHRSLPYLDMCCVSRKQAPPPCSPNRPAQRGS